MEVLKPVFTVVLKGLWSFCKMIVLQVSNKIWQYNLKNCILS